MALFVLREEDPEDNLFGTTCDLHDMHREAAKWKKINGYSTGMNSFTCLVFPSYMKFFLQFPVLFNYVILGWVVMLQILL